MQENCKFKLSLTVHISRIFPSSGNFWNLYYRHGEVRCTLTHLISCSRSLLEHLQRPSHFHSKAALSEWGPEMSSPLPGAASSPASNLDPVPFYPCDFGCFISLSLFPRLQSKNNYALGGSCLLLITMIVIIMTMVVVSDSATPWTVVRQALLSMRFPRQKCWSG